MGENMDIFHDVEFEHQKIEKKIHTMVVFIQA